ncbi:hypothetical protein EV589_4896 [Mycobacterium sp. BK558]|nr:hypothetical protein EV589_4896 [Mycobacterium sp. BK558]
MTLLDPRSSLAEHSSLIGYLMGVAAVAQAIDEMALDTSRGSDCTADDFVYVLVGVASLGRAIENLAGSVVVAAAHPSPSPPQRWLR